MSLEHKEATAPRSPVGPGGEQSPGLETKGSIAEISTNCNKQVMEGGLETYTMTELYEKKLQGRAPVIDGLLYPGTYIFAGASKIGKSFLSLQIAYHVSLGSPLWGMKVRQGAVLYMALEDSLDRLQMRLYGMFGDEASDDLYLCTRSAHLRQGLTEQIESFLDERPDTVLVIIDTLQMIRDDNIGRASYGGDYDVIEAIKDISDRNRIAVLLVHHTRKQGAEDRFHTISGTTGLMGGADGAWLLLKKDRADKQAVLEITGRDVPDQRFYLTQKEDTLIWEMERAEKNICQEKPDPTLLKVLQLMEGRIEWTGTATELAGALGLEIQPNSLTRRLNILSWELFSKYNIGVDTVRYHTGRRLILTRFPTEA